MARRRTGRASIHHRSVSIALVGALVSRSRMSCPSFALNKSEPRLAITKSRTSHSDFISPSFECPFRQKQVADLVGHRKGQHLFDQNTVVEIFDGHLLNTIPVDEGHAAALVRRA
jgi:hypothetical protein